MNNKRVLQVAVVIFVIVCAFLGYLYISTHNNLLAAQSDLLDTQYHLTLTQDNLADTQNQLITTQNQLAIVQEQLNQVQNQLTDANNKLSAITGLPSPIIKVGTYLEGYEMVDGDNRDIVLIGNPNATDPTWTELLSFLSSDDTCKQVYTYPSFVCSNYAEMLYYHSEKAGIRAGYVNIDFGMYLIPCDIYTGCCPAIGFHACNAFNTSDKGLIFIDATGTTAGSGEPTIVNVAIGQIYQPMSIFSNTSWCPMGTVQNFNVDW